MQQSHQERPAPFIRKRGEPGVHGAGTLARKPSSCHQELTAAERAERILATRWSGAYSKAAPSARVPQTGH